MRSSRQRSRSYSRTIRRLPAFAVPAEIYGGSESCRDRRRSNRGGRTGPPQAACHGRTFLLSFPAWASGAQRPGSYRRPDSAAASARGPVARSICSGATEGPRAVSEVTWTGRRFGAIHTFREWTFGRYVPLRQPQPADLPEDRLLPDSRNLALVLNQIEHAGDIRLNQLLRQFFPRFERMSTPISGGRVQFYLHESGFRAPIPATRLSDGTIRFIAILATLLSPSPPPLVCIEEPELGLHPDAVGCSPICSSMRPKERNSWSPRIPMPWFLR